METGEREREGERETDRNGPLAASHPIGEFGCTSLSTSLGHMYINRAACLFVIIQIPFIFIHSILQEDIKSLVGATLSPIRHCGAEQSTNTESVYLPLDSACSACNSVGLPHRFQEATDSFTVYLHKPLGERRSCSKTRNRNVGTQIRGVFCQLGKLLV